MAAASWVSDVWLAIDFESTGVDPFNDRIVEAAAVEILPDGSTGLEWSTIVDPGCVIPDEAAAIHGITTERARLEGVPTVEALAQMADRIFRHGYRPVVGYNLTFDWPLAICEAERCGLEFPCFAPVLDPYLIDRMCDQYRPGKRRLQLVADHYGVALSNEDAHGALSDAIAAGRVMRRLVESFPQIGEHTLAGVFLRQVRGHEQDRLRFVDYMRRNTDPTFDKAPGWPIPAGVS